MVAELVTWPYTFGHDAVDDPAGESYVRASWNQIEHAGISSTMRTIVCFPPWRPPVHLGWASRRVSTVAVSPDKVAGTHSSGSVAHSERARDLACA
ncbi:hypothetical protein [Rhodococcus sovatensis]|uniref:Uncharacterized protein n=1 Tax=Rhodococcus sovatensis TaxID=1805840 RepID=A0ABZ2PMX9_9NOCA